MTKKSRPSHRAGRLRYAIPDYCALPVGGDTYRNCPNKCLYCYERQANNQHLRNMAVTPLDHRTLYRSLTEDPAVWEFATRRKVPIRLGNCADPFPPLERKAHSTARFLTLLQRTGYNQIQLTTKRPDVVDDDMILLLLKFDKAMIRVSFSTFDDSKAAVLEPHAPRPSERLQHMRRLADRGIEIGGRVAPFFHTEDYDYSLFAQAGCSNVTLELFRWSILWRHSTDPRIWEVLVGGQFPGGNTKKGSPGRAWVERQEKSYFAPLQKLSRHPYNSPGNLWISIDVHVLRRLWQTEQAKVKAAGMRFGFCSFGSGIHNIDLNDAPCACLSPGWRYDPGALVPQWFEDQWLKYRLDIAQEYLRDTWIERFSVANLETYRPLAMDPDVRPELGRWTDMDCLDLGFDIGSNRTLT